MTEPVAVHTFLSHLRTGVGAFPKASPGAEPLRRTLEVGVTLNDDPTHTAGTQVELHGPADVSGLDPALVVRTVPAAGAVDVEPNYFAAAEFDPPDLPWRYSALPAADGRVLPWLALVVLREDEFVRVPAAPGLPAAISVADPATALPVADQRWAWAHVQVAGRTDGADAGAAALATQQSEPARVVSRLMCPRRLAPVTQYHAFVVPAFEAGRLSGLGQPPGADGGAAAWSAGAATGLPLPCYFEWTFRTGRGGDFESLVRRLQPRQLDGRVGTRPMAVGPQAYSVPAIADPVPLDSALRHVSAPPPPMPDQTAFRDRLTTVLNAPSDLQGGRPGTPRALAPPLVAMWHAQRFVLDPANDDWFAELNLDPRRRGQSGLGADVIRSQQEALMAEAWRQVGDIERANEARRRAQLGRAAGRRWWTRQLGRVDAATLTAMTAQVHGSVRAGPASVRSLIVGARLPAAAVTPAMRRVSAPRTALAKRLTLPARNAFVARLDAGDIAAAGPAPATIPGMIQMTALPVAGAVSGRFAAAAAPVIERLRMVPSEQAPPPPADLAQVRADLLTGLDPNATIPRRVLSGIREVRPVRPETAPPQTDPIEPIMAAPEFDHAMYGPLRDLTPEHLLAGLEHVPVDTLALVRTNRAYIEAYLAGLNHEMSRELLWRGYPTDQRGTYFRRFFDAPDPDITALHTWPDGSVLGDHEARPALVDEPLVLLIRGELLRRYPTAVIYAVAARWDAAAGRRDLDESQIQVPLFRGTLPADVTFVGFDLTPQMAHGTADPNSPDQGWFFVIQEQPTEPRFGLDEADGPAATAPGAWDDLSWGHFAADDAAFTALDHLDLSVDPPQWPWAIDGTGDPPVRWRSRAAEMAVATLQQPARVAVHASRMLP